MDSSNHVNIIMKLASYCVSQIPRQYIHLTKKKKGFNLITKSLNEEIIKIQQMYN